MRNMITIVCALVVLVWAGQALGTGATDINFTDLAGGGDHTWTTDANWDDPVDGSPNDPTDDNAWIGDGLTCEIRGTATPRRMKIGTAGGAGIVEIYTGGHLDLTLGGSNWFGCGATGDGFGDGTLRMLGGTVTCCGCTTGGANQTGTIEIQSGTLDVISGGVCGMSIGGGGYDSSGKVGIVTQTGGTLNLRSTSDGAVMNVGGNEYWRGNIHDCTGLYTISGGTLNQYGDEPDAGGAVPTMAGMILGTKAYSGSYACTGNTGTLNVKGKWEPTVDNIKLNALRMYREGDGNDAILIYDIDGTDGIETVVVANAAMFAGKLVVTTTGSDPTEPYTLMTYASATGDFDETDLPSGWTYNVGATALTVIPEPATLTLLGLGGLGVLIRRKRR